MSVMIEPSGCPHDQIVIGQANAEPQQFLSASEAVRLSVVTLSGSTSPWNVREHGTTNLPS
jgi:hypothetical protein